MNRTEEDDSRALSIYGPRIAIDLPYTCQCARTWPPPSMQWNRSHLHVSWGEKVYTPSLKKTRNDVFINTNRRTDAENFCSPSLYNFLCLILIPKKKSFIVAGTMDSSTEMDSRILSKCSGCFRERRMLGLRINPITVTLAICFIFLCFRHQPVSAFNLDIKTPLTQRGNRGDMFGYSVAQHIDQGNSW